MPVLVPQFLKDEEGAVTVDWVVLTAAIVGLGLVVVTAIRGGLLGASTNIADTLATLHTVFAW